MNLAKSTKVKVGILFGYNGEKFLGLQYQRDTDNTVENILHKVLCEQGFILKTNMENLRRIKWSRAGRTDKSVHALCNGISCSLQLDERYVIDKENRVFDLEKVAKDINADLPMDIRIFAVKKVGKGFDMRHDACSRVYNYLAPLKLFLSKPEFLKNHILNELEKQELVEKLNNLASLYLGTHSFHNFTKGYKQNDPKCDRYIMKMNVELVQESTVENCLATLYPHQEKRKEHRISFLRFTLVGQSFIYHQIRKMIGLLVKICYEELQGEETIKRAFSKEKYDIYLAPGEGLYLNRMTFDSYNKKKESIHRVELNETDQQKIEEYKKFLEGKILTHEFKDEVFSKWLQKHEEQAEQSQAQGSENADEQ